MKECGWFQVCMADEIGDGAIVEKRIEGQDIVLMRVGEQIFAAQAICPHMDEKLCNGLLKKSRLICTKHLWQWDLETGAPIGAAEKPIRVYQTRLDDGFIYVCV